MAPHVSRPSARRDAPPGRRPRLAARLAHALPVAWLALLLAAPGCVVHDRLDEKGVHLVNDLGQPVTHHVTTAFGMHFLYVLPLFGDATLGRTVKAFGDRAAALAAPTVRIVQTNTEVYWYALPPVTFLIQPVVTTVAGDLEIPPGGFADPDPAPDGSAPPVTDR